MVEPPYWLTNKGVDEIDVDEYDKLRQEMMTIMRTEEAANLSETSLEDAAGTPLRVSEIMEQALASGGFLLLGLASGGGKVWGARAL